MSGPVPSYYVEYDNTDINPCATPCTRVGNCGYGFNVTCDPAVIAAACDATLGCLVFNSNGWLKSCGSTVCNAVFEPLDGVTSWVKDGGFAPQVPVAPIDDDWYPPEQPAEVQVYDQTLPTLLSTGGSGISAWALLQQGSSGAQQQNVTVSFAAFGSYTLLAVNILYPADNPVLPNVVLQRTFARWSALSLLTLGREASRLTSTVGAAYNLTQANFTGLMLGQPSYYASIQMNLSDTIGLRVMAETGGEATYLESAKYLPPQRDYASIGAIWPYQKWSVSPDGLIKSANNTIYSPAGNSSLPQPGLLLFAPQNYLPPGLWPATNWTATKAGLVGGYLRVVSTAGFDSTRLVGFEQTAFAPASDSSGAALIRLRAITASNSTASPFAYYNASFTGGIQQLVDGNAFYAALFAEKDMWAATFAPAMALSLPGAEGARQVDMMWGALVTSVSLYVGFESNYGDGSDYWSANTSLPSQVVPVDVALVDLGLSGWAADRLANFAGYFIYPDGSLDTCRPCKEGGFGDALADYGEVQDLFVRTARAMMLYNATGPQWLKQWMPSFVALTNYSFNMRVNASVHGAGVGDVTHGLIYGSPEHDTCGEQDYYYHNSVWTLRGMMQAGPFLQQYGGPEHQALAAAIMADIPVFAADIAASLAQTVTFNASTGAPFFIPPLAQLNFTPFGSMSESVLSSYSNFRYYAELLSSDILSADMAQALMDFREQHDGVIGGTNRFEDHLDNMPVYHYSFAFMRHERTASFWTMLYGSMALYGSRGTFSATEQVPYTADSLGVWRDYLWEYLEGGIDQCVPSIMLTALSTRWSVVWEAWGTDATVWLARAAPRRWYAHPQGFNVTAAPTTYGIVTYGIQNNGNASSVAQISWAPPPYLRPQDAGAVTVVIKLRAASADWSMTGVTMQGGNGLATLQQWDAAQEAATVVLSSNAAPVKFSLTATFAPA